MTKRDSDEGMTDMDVVKEKDQGSSPDPSVDLGDEESRRDFAESIHHQLLVSQSWSGRLPNPHDLREYEAIVSGSAKEIVDEMLQDSKVMQQSVDIDRDTSDRLLTIMERREERNLEESRSDRDVRDITIKWIVALMFLYAAIFILIILYPMDVGSRLAAFTAWGIVVVAPMVVIALRGRHSDQERDVLTNLPDIVRAAVKGEVQKQDVPAPLPNEDQSLPE